MRNDPKQRELELEKKENRVSIELKRNKRDQSPLRQSPAIDKKKRTGVRPFPPALIARIAKEGKLLAKEHGRRQTSRILLERYPMANLSKTSADR